MARLTRQFPPHVKPVRPGVYATDMRSSIGHIIEAGYSYWSGTRWHNQMLSIHDAAEAGPEGADQDKYWRGLAEKPK